MVGAPLALARRPDKPIKAKIRFLADSTIVRPSYGESEDVYLVELANEKGGEPVTAWLIDTYPPYHAGIALAILTSPTGTILKLRRDPACDGKFGALPLRTAPGDPMAILSERLGYHPTLPRPVSASDILPCYRAAR